MTTQTPTRFDPECSECVRMVGEINAALANGLVLKARPIERRLSAHSGIHEPTDTPAPETPRTEAGPFSLIRDVDATGISGTGRVAQGFVFDDGTAVLRWLSEHRSTAVYASLAEVEAIHGHNGSTRIEREAATPAATEALRRTLDNLLRHHNAGSDHVPSTNPHLPDCEFAREAAAALASPVPTP